MEVLQINWNPLYLDGCSITYYICDFRIDCCTKYGYEMMVTELIILCNDCIESWEWITYDSSFIYSDFLGDYCHWKYGPESINTKRDNYNLSEFNKLPVHIMNKICEDKNMKCVICIDDKLQIHVTKCGHIYCNECYIKLFQETHPKCAVCRQSFKKICLGDQKN